MKPGSGISIRLKLTLLYGGLFLIAGLILISTTYVLVRRELATPNPPRITDSPGTRGGDRDGQDDDAPEDPEERENRARQEERSNAIREIRRQSFFALIFTASGSLVLGWIVAGRVLAPIRKITEHAQQASAATLDERIDLHGPADELKNLADTFDAMLDRLQAAFEAQRIFAAQASHELRTPLAIIRAEAEITRNRPNLDSEERSSVDAILLAAVRSERLVDGLLALSRSESTLVNRTTIDFAGLTGDVVAEHSADADRAGIRLDLNLSDAWIAGDAPLLERLVTNLVQNGIRYNHSGGSVTISVATTGSHVVLSVANTGPDLTQSEIDTLFKPFARGTWATRNRTGHGLGLAIVQSVVRAHGGTVRSTPGESGGLLVEVTLPALVHPNL